MGFAADSMHTYIERDLKKKFPIKEGWKIERNPVRDGVSFDYEVMRRRFGTMKRYPVTVMITPKVTDGDVVDLQTKIDALNDQGVMVDHPLLIVPTGADIAAIPDSYEVLYLKVLKVEEGEVIWWRKTVEQ